MQWPIVNTLFQEKKEHHNQKDGSKGTPNWTVLEVTTSYLHGTHDVAIRIWSVNRDNTHSWVRISDGSNRFVMNLKKQTSEMQFEEHALQLERFCLPMKGKSKTTKKRTC